MNWKSMSVFHKIVTIISFLIVIAWVIFKFISDLLPFDPTLPAIAAYTACEAVLYWNTKRKWAYLLIAGAVISFAFSLLDLIILK